MSTRALGSRWTVVFAVASAAAMFGCGGGGSSGNSSGASTNPAISLSTMTLPFGSQGTGTTSGAQIVTVSNIGAGTLTVSGVTITGTAAALFAETNTCTSVAPNGTCTVSVTFSPSAIGADAATLSIASNVIGSPTDVALTGTGAASGGSNTVAGIIDAGPAALSSPAVNILYVSATVCVPGTQTCQVVDHLQVDTGSEGVRVLASALTNPSVASGLTTVTSHAGHSLVECTQFADGYSWGPVKTADVTIGGQTVSALSIQVIGDAAYPVSTVPSICTTGPGGNTEEDSVGAFGANGIVGIGFFLQDCGASCASDGSVYNDCNGTTCTGYRALTSEQLPNPVGKLPLDNNGVIIEMPSVPSAGSTDVTATIVFGIGTQGNNALLAGATVYTVSPNTGEFGVSFENTSLNQSFIDSGSNAYYFPNLTTPKLTACAAPNPSFYCPSPDTVVSVTIFSADGLVTNSFAVPVNSLSELGASTTAFPGFAGTITGLPTSFDFGLPFFFGKSMYVAFEGSTLGGKTAPALSWY